MKITYYGHSTFLAEIDGHRVLFDPFISPNDLAKGVNIDNIECDFMLITHGHQDHVADVESIAKRTGCKIITNFEIVDWLGKKGLDNAHPMNHGGAVDMPFGRVKYVAAVHSSMLPDGANGGNPGGFVITTDKMTIYYAGDTALTMDMQLLGKFHDIDHAFLPIGDNFTMGVDDAIIAADFIDCKNIIGMHYDTFPPIKLDHNKAKEKFQASGLNLKLADIEETFELK